MLLIKEIENTVLKQNAIWFTQPQATIIRVFYTAKDPTFLISPPRSELKVLTKPYSLDTEIPINNGNKHHHKATIVWGKIGSKLNQQATGLMRPNLPNVSQLKSEQNPIEACQTSNTNSVFMVYLI